MCECLYLFFSASSNLLVLLSPSVNELLSIIECFFSFFINSFCSIDHLFNSSICLFLAHLVTAQEIHRALANNRQKQRRIICFFRELNDIEELDSKFHDNKEDKEECKQLLTDAKQLLQQSVDLSDIYFYKVNKETNIEFDLRQSFHFSSDGKMKSIETII